MWQARWVLQQQDLMVTVVSSMHCYAASAAHLAALALPGQAARTKHARSDLCCSVRAVPLSVVPGLPGVQLPGFQLQQTAVHTGLKGDAVMGQLVPVQNICWLGSGCRGVEFRD